MIREAWRVADRPLAPLNLMSDRVPPTWVGEAALREGVSRYQRLSRDGERRRRSS